MKEMRAEPILKELLKAREAIELEMEESNYIPHIRELIRLHNGYSIAIHELEKMLGIHKQ